MTRVLLGTRDTSRYPEFAGSTWVRLQYLLGLQRLGVECHWIDRLRAAGAEYAETGERHARYYAALLEQQGLYHYLYTLRLSELPV